MKKKLVLILLLNLGVFSVSQTNAAIINDNSNNVIELQQLKYGKGYIAVGNINVSITEQIKLKPDTVQFLITYITEGTTPNDASNRNVSNMKKFTEYLTQLGIKDDDLTTVSYQNYENSKQQSVANTAKKYESTFTIHLSIDNEQFLNVVNVLDKNQINDIQQDSYQKYYSFKIKETSNTGEKAQQLNQQKYKVIVAHLKKLGIQDISIAGYDTKVISPKNETVKKYYVRNTMQIKVNSFDLTGKIITKAQELKMTVNNNMDYSVSTSEKDRILAQYEQHIYQKLADKATRLLGQQYQLGMATNLNSNENNNIYQMQPRYYGYNSQSMINAGQNQSFDASEVDIQPPSEFSMTLTMSGTFDIVKKISE